MEEERKLHVVMFPWLAFGHMIPFLELSKSIAHMDHRISFISTQRNIERLPRIPPNLSHLLIYVKLPLPQVEDLPAEAEATMDLPFNKVYYLKKAFDGLAEPLARFLETSDADWIIHDPMSSWLPTIASKLGMQCGVFSTFNAAFLCYIGPPSDMMAVGGSSRKSLEDYTSPPKWIPFPSNLSYHSHELLKLARADDKGMGASDMLRLGVSVQGCDVVFVRSCMEFESEWLQLLEELYEKTVLPVGLIPPRVDENNVDGEDEKWLVMKKWLDKHEEKSVIYVALGTEATLSCHEVTELAHGLELSQLPFVWVLRTPPGTGQDYWEGMLPSGFMARINNRGLVYTSWAPQVQILRHVSIGCFLTHCGWNSVIEGLGTGCPLVLLPIMNEQPLNARVLGWKEVGLEIPRDENNGDLNRKEVASALKMVMVDEGREIFRAKAKEMKEIFGNVALQDKYVRDFEHFLKAHRGRSSLSE